MMRLALISILAFVLPGVLPAEAQPSYSCGGRLNAAERAICDDPGLSALDRDMAAQFFAIQDRLSGNRKARFEDEQTGWRRDRDACGAAVGCLRANYVYRISQFDAMTGGGGGSEGPTRLVDTRVLPDGTIEKRTADGGKILLLPNGNTERYMANGTKIPMNTIAGNVQTASLPPLPQPLQPWASGLETSLLRILGNILTENEYAAYLPTESGKNEYGLIDWRVRSITFLTQP